LSRPASAAAPNTAPSHTAGFSDGSRPGPDHDLDLDLDHDHDLDHDESNPALHIAAFIYF
jgi:hypothetical protein